MIDALTKTPTESIEHSKINNTTVNETVPSPDVSVPVIAVLITLAFSVVPVVPVEPVVLVSGHIRLSVPN